MNISEDKILYDEKNLKVLILPVLEFCNDSNIPRYFYFASQASEYTLEWV